MFTVQKMKFFIKAFFSFFKNINKTVCCIRAILSEPGSPIEVFPEMFLVLKNSNMRLPSKTFD